MAQASHHPSPRGDIATFRFTYRQLDADGQVRLGYAFDDVWQFEERLTLPMPTAEWDAPWVEAALALLHWTAGVSYYKAFIPPSVEFTSAPPWPAAAALLEALYCEGLGEFAVVNGLERLPRPSFASHPWSPLPAHEGPVARALVAVGGGKDSTVALEAMRHCGVEVTAFSIGTATPIAATIAAAEVPWLTVTRRLDPALFDLNARGALNGHVPVTAIVMCTALLTAALHGHDAVVMANERSASSGNVAFDGVEVNHQFSKGWAVEQLLREAIAAQMGGTPQVFSALRRASELAVARAFARLPAYHPVFTSCNRLFHIDEARRHTTWCGQCDKCRFVALILAPFFSPQHLTDVFGADLLNDEQQYRDFALLLAHDGHKPFECVGEVDECIAAVRMLADDPRWQHHRVVRRLNDEVVAHLPASRGRPADALRLAGPHGMPASLAECVDAFLTG